MTKKLFKKNEPVQFKAVFIDDNKMSENEQ